MDKTPKEILEEVKEIKASMDAHLKFVKDTVDKRLSKNPMEKQKFINLKLHRLNEQLRKVTPELFARFLDERGASRTCLSCGSNRLSVPETSTVDKTKLPENFTDLTIEEQARLYTDAMTQHISYTFIEEENWPRLSNVKYRVNCMNCGFISFYRAWPIVQWVLDQEDGDKDE